MTGPKKPRPTAEALTSDTLCRCGHELGDHRASTARECLADGGCPCERFRMAKEKAP